MKPELEGLLKALKKAGWQVEMRPPELGEVTLPEAVRERFGRLPDDYLEFLASVKKCANPEGNAWFLTVNDFAVSDSTTFAWNWIEEEFPDCKYEGDTAWPAFWRKYDGDDTAWRAFWREHLPIFFSVHSDYDYLALRFTQAEPGRSVVLGFAPEFESPSRVADSFTHLCVMLTQFFERDQPLPGCVSAIL